MKGYELYSWEENSTWNYTLITGTNRNKTYDEVVADDDVETKEWVKITVQDLGEIKQVLKRIPSEQFVSWVGPSRAPGFSFPPSSTVSEIENLCKDLKLNFQVGQ